MIVLSLFDGMGCGITALKRAGIPVAKYYASEVDKYAIQIAKKNHPEIVHLGDVQNWRHWDIEKPDLIIGGSPCQGFSFAGKQLAFDDPRSALFFTMVEIINHFKPTYRLLENVKMRKDYLEVVSQYMGVEPVFINSALVSAQNRQRYYWCNWHVDQPEDKGIVLKDILEDGEGVIKTHGTWKPKTDKSQCLDANYHKGVDNHGQRTVVSNDCVALGHADINGHDVLKRVYSDEGKCPILTAFCGGNQEKKIAVDEIHWRKLTPIECERLQTLPDNYTEGVSNTQRYKMLGNGWTVDVIAHIFEAMKEPQSVEEYRCKDTLDMFE